MTAYVNILTKEYPRHPGDLELLGWVQGEPLPENWAEVIEVELPINADDEKLIIDYPVEKDGKWYMNPVIVKMTPEEIAKKISDAKEQENIIKQNFTKEQ